MVLAGSGVDATVGEGRFNPTTSSCNILRVCSRNSILPGISAAGVSPAEGCNDGDKCDCDDVPGLMSIGALWGGGKLGMITSPGGSIVSSPLELGNSPCTSLVATCRVGEGMVRVVAHAAVASGEGPPGSAGVHVHPFSSSLLVRAASTV